MIPHVFYPLKEVETHIHIHKFSRHTPNNPMTSRSKHFLPSTPPYIHPPSPQKDKNNPTCELQFDVRLPAAMGMCRRQLGSLATGCSYLRLVQTKSRGGLIFPGVGAVAGWGGVPGSTQGSGGVYTSLPLPFVLYRTEGLAAYPYECQSADVQLVRVGWKASTEAERVTPKEKCLCCQRIL